MMDGSGASTLKRVCLVTYSDSFRLVSKLATFKLCNIYMTLYLCILSVQYAISCTLFNT